MPAGHAKRPGALDGPLQERRHINMSSQPEKGQMIRLPVLIKLQEECPGGETRELNVEPQGEAKGAFVCDIGIVKRTGIN